MRRLHDDKAIDVRCIDVDTLGRYQTTKKLAQAKTVRLILDM